MMGIVWGIMAVTLLLAYGGGFRDVLCIRPRFGKGAVITWPGTTSDKPGASAPAKVQFEPADVEQIQRQLQPGERVLRGKTVPDENIRSKNQSASTAIRGVFQNMGTIAQRDAQRGAVVLTR